MNYAQCKQWVRDHADIMIDLIRIYLGLGLIFKGVYFTGHSGYLLQLMDESTGKALVTTAMAHYVIPAHLFGGLLLVVGLVTRAAALAQIPILVYAVFFIYLPKMVNVEPRQSLEFTALVLFLMCIIFVFGAGRLSVDHLLFRRKSEVRSAPLTAAPGHA